MFFLSVCVAEDPANRTREEKKRFRSRQTASKQGTNHSDSYSRRIDLPRSNAVAREARTFAYVPLQNDSDHAVVASYSGLYEECDVEHINVFGLVFYTRQLVFCSELWILREMCTIMRRSSRDVACRNNKTMCLLWPRQPFFDRAVSLTLSASHSRVAN